MNRLLKKTIKYLQYYGIPLRRPVRTASTEGVKKVVVIPALAESSSLFRTLASIAGNPSNELAESLVLCVVNNHPPPLASPEQIRDNRETMALLQDILLGNNSLHSSPAEMRDDLKKIAGSGLRLGWIDASSPGMEIPKRDGGVGTARKIGMDAALTLLDGRGPGGGLIACLDADTLVETNYLSSVDSHFSRTLNPAAVTRYAHQRPDSPGLLSAICGYETYLRAYVMGLSFAGSPYAFHAIGSTMACTMQAYVDVRGMNRRIAAEDFHFLNKMAKIGCIGVIEETTVFPSARPSERVPFGTGRRMLQAMSVDKDEYRLYDPRIFLIIRAWLTAMEDDPDRDSDSILNDARKIHTELKAYLDFCRFAVTWADIRRNCPDSAHLRRQFHVWFDGLKTLRLINHLSRSAFPPVPMFEGLKTLIQRMGPEIPLITGIPFDIPELEMQIQILEELRSRFPKS